jgi:hypothetical protein
MPALLIATIAQERSHSLINWRFLVAFVGGSFLCFILALGIMSMAASMTNTGFVALPKHIRERNENRSIMGLTTEATSFSSSCSVVPQRAKMCRA